MVAPRPIRVARLEEEGLDAPALAPYRTLRRQPDHLREGIFVAEGPTVVERLLASGLEVVSVLATEEWAGRLLPGCVPGVPGVPGAPGAPGAPGVPDVPAHLDARPGGLHPAPGAPARAPLALYLATPALLERLTGFEYHQGVMALARVPRDPDLDAILRSSPAPRTLVALDGLTSAENVGVIVRAASALGAAAVIAGGTSASPFLRRAVRTSMGGAFFTPVVHAGDLAALLARLAREHGVRSCAAVLAEDAAPLARYRFGEPACIVLGHEFDGVSPSVTAVCADRVTIPMARHLDSLNVQTAGAIFLFEAARQRAG